MVLQGKTILITGAAGSIGSALSRMIHAKKPKKLVLLDNNETDLFDLTEDLKGSVPVVASIRDEKRMDAILYKFMPQFVFHVAAYKHVAMMEQHPMEAIQTNIGGTMNLAFLATQYGVEKFVFVSSDKAVNPFSVMGISKKYGEKICLFANSFSKTKFVVVRFGNVMASRGSVIPIFQKQIQEGKNLTVTHKDMKRYFMGIYDAVALILDAARIGRGGETFVFDMGDPMRITELAEMMIKLSGKPLSIEYIAPKSGEKFGEELMTAEEKKRAVKKKKLYVIR